MWQERNIIIQLLLLCALPYSKVTGQITDCIGAQVICSDGPVDFTPNGGGKNDFANPNNRSGCLITEPPENQSAWYYFEFRTDMPPNSVIEFTITPYGEAQEDYDFAIYGPNLSCDSLGDPVRCSYAIWTCAFCPKTGLGMGAMDNTEDAYSDGFIAPMVVQPGEGFYMILDNFRGTSVGFELTWGGSAAPFLNCLANPACNNVKVDAGTDMELCQGGASFLLDASATPVSNAVRYSWSGTPETIAFLDDPTLKNPLVSIPAAFADTIIYTLTLKDGSCEKKDSVVIIVHPSPALDLGADTTVCANQAYVLSPGDFERYSWSTADTLASITLFQPGAYWLTVTDSNGCVASDSIQFNHFSLPIPRLQGDTILCGAASGNLSTETTYADYSWSSGENTPLISIANPGTYSVTVTDANGCQGVAAVVIKQFENPMPSINPPAPLCPGENAVLSTTDNYADYQWSNNSKTATILVTEAGNYAVTVTDSNGCSGSDEVSVIVSDLPDITFSGATTFCADGQTEVGVTENGLQYSWSNGANTQAVTVSESAMLTVTVTNADGCKQTASITVTENPPLQITFEGERNICPGSSTIIQPSSTFESYLWSTGSTDRSIEVTNPGPYTLQVTDNLGCTATAAFQVNLFPETSVEIRGDSVFCPGTRLLLVPNTVFDTYEWSTGATSANIEIDQPNTYFLTVRDGNGCIGRDSITVRQFATNPPLPRQTVSFCQGGSTILDPGNFVAYNWSDNSTDSTLGVAVAGNYTVQVTDANGCSAIAEFEVIERALPDATITGDTIICSGNETANLTGTSSTGISYLWSTGATTAQITVAVPATYTLIVRDSFGCTNTDDIKVSQKVLNTPTVDAPPGICNGDRIKVRVNEAFAHYNWSNGKDGQQIEVSVAGTYQVTVTDLDGCQSIATVDLLEWQADPLTIEGDSVVCQNAMIVLSATPGFKTYNWSNGEINQNITISEPGVYIVTATNENGCKTVISKNIQQKNIPTADAGVEQIIDCITREVTLGGASSSQGASISYAWQGPGIDNANAQLQFPKVSQGGLYTLVVRDNDSNCQSSVATVRVSDFSYEFEIELAAQGTLSCEQPAVPISVTGITNEERMVYQWADSANNLIMGARDRTFLAQQTGRYFLVARDTLYGCSASAEVVVEGDLTQPEANAGEDQELTCIIKSVVLNRSSTPPRSDFIYNWKTSNGNILAGEDSLTPLINRGGLYILEITDKINGCTASDTVVVTEDTAKPFVDAGPDRELNCQVETVTLSGAGSASGSPIEYQWQTNSGQTIEQPAAKQITVQQPGLYQLTVINLENGCAASDSVSVIDVSDYPTAVEIQVIDPTCFGKRDGQVIIGSITGGKAPYLYSFNNAPLSSISTFSNLGAGKYLFTVEDVKGCTFSKELTVADGRIFEISLGQDQFIKLSQEVTLKVQANIDASEVATLAWKGDKLECLENCWTQEVKPFRTTTYAVTATDIKGCQASDEVAVFVDARKGVFIPTAFSPNGNGINDVFMIYGGPEATTIRYLRVFDRWGDLLFEATNFNPNDPAFGWDGHYRGKLLDPATFVFVAEVEFIDGGRELFKGEVVLTR